MHLALIDVYDRRYALHLTTSPYELAQCIIQMSVGAILFVAWVGTWCSLLVLCRCWVGARVVRFTACWSRDSNMIMMSLCWYMYITFAAALTFVTSTMYLEVAHNGKAIPLLQNGDVAENVLEGNLNPREATVPVLHWACAACAPNSVVLCQDGTKKVVSSRRLELKAARSCTAASAVTSDDNGNR